MATYSVAQVMTRGMVKSRLIHVNEWVIRSQAPLLKINKASVPFV